MNVSSRRTLQIAALSVLALGVSHWVRASAARSNRPRSALTTVKAVINAYNRHDLEAFLRLHSAALATSAPSTPTVRGLSGLGGSLPQEWRAFPDARLRIKRMVADDRQVAVEAVWTGTYRRTLGGFPPAQGQKVRLSQVGWYTVKGGRVNTLRSYFNPADLHRQLNAKTTRSSTVVPGASPSKRRREG